MNRTAGIMMLLLLFPALVTDETAAMTRTWAPGVANGDYFTYSMYGVYTSNHPNETMTIPQFEYNNTDWTRINITSVEDSVVNQIYTLHFKNGSETSFNFKADVNPEGNNALEFSQKGVPICAADLNAGDRVPTDDLIIIGDVVNRAYGSGFRETTHASWNSSVDWGNLYFDRETGMLVELNRTHRFTNASSGGIVDKTDVIKLSSTNRWLVEENPQPHKRFYTLWP